MTSQAATKMIEIARSVCASHATTTDDMYMGKMHSFEHAPTAELADGRIYITMACDRVMSRERAQEIVRAAMLAATVAWAEAGLLPGGMYTPVRVRKALTWSLGYWHMGQWCITGYRRGVRVPECAAAAA